MTYTVDIEKDLLQTYNAANSDEERGEVVKTLAGRHQKPVASVRAKLVKMGVYKKPNSSKRSVKKDELVRLIATITGKDEELMDSLEKATKLALNAVLETFASAEKRIQELENHVSVLEDTLDANGIELETQKEEEVA